MDAGIAAVAYSSGEIVMQVAPTLSYLAHEMSHQLDWHALPEYGFGFSNNRIWQDNFWADSAAVSDYANTNWAENFAEVGIVGVYDKVVWGGIGQITSNWGAIFHQCEFHSCR